MKYREFLQEHKPIYVYKWRLVKMYPDGSPKFIECDTCHARVPVRELIGGWTCQLCDNLPGEMEKAARLHNMLLLALGAFDDVEVIDEA